MSHCKTQADLHRRMADVYDFCKGTKFDGHEEECVKYYKSVMSFIPAFTDKSDCYEFALGIVEDKLVWEGDTLYGRTSGDQFTVGKSFAFTKQQGAIQELSWNPPAPPKPKTVSISVNGGEPITIDQMVDRFLSWKLPEHFHPDAGISFKPDYNENTPYPMKHKPIGTNLFTADQARAMLLYLLSGDY